MLLSSLMKEQSRSSHDVSDIAAFLKSLTAADELGGLF
jgi:hypothetical protein